MIQFMPANHSFISFTMEESEGVKCIVYSYFINVKETIIFSPEAMEMIWETVT